MYSTNYFTILLKHLPTTFQGDKGQDAKQAQLQTELQAATDAVSAAAWSDVCPRTAIHGCKGRLRSSRAGTVWEAHRTRPRLLTACSGLPSVTLGGPLGAEPAPPLGGC